MVKAALIQNTLFAFRWTKAKELMLNFIEVDLNEYINSFDLCIPCSDTVDSAAHTIFDTEDYDSIDILGRLYETLDGVLPHKCNNADYCHCMLTHTNTKRKAV